MKTCNDEQTEKEKKKQNVYVFRSSM